MEGAPVGESGLHILAGNDVVFKTDFLQQGEDILLHGVVAVKSGIGKSDGHHGVDGQQCDCLFANLAGVVWAAFPEMPVGLPVFVGGKVGDVCQRFRTLAV